MFKKKTEVMSVKEFMQRGKKVVEAEVVRVPNEVCLVPLLVGAPLIKKVFTPISAYAEGNIASQTADKIADKAVGAIMDKVVHAFDPVIVLAQALAYPVAMVMLIGGALYIMVGSKEAGFKMIQRAGIGYILVQLMPLVMDLLVEVGKAI